VTRGDRNAHLSKARNVRSGHANRSAKVEGIRSWFAQWLDETLHTAEGWKRMRDTTRDDWLYAARERQQHILAESLRMRQCQRMAALFDKYKVTTAAELPESAVLDVFSEAAA
jgi:hypothetical protein